MEGLFCSIQEVKDETERVRLYTGIVQPAMPNCYLFGQEPQNLPFFLYFLQHFFFFPNASNWQQENTTGVSIWVYAASSFILI